jgi:hypothetical protein
MKTSLTWIKIGFLIGLGFVLAQFLLPLGLIALFLVPVVVLIASLAMFCGRMKSAWLLRRGWTEREQK